MALLSRPWTVTPPDGFTINWGHPLARGLVEVIISPRFGKRSAVNNIVPGGTLATATYGFGAGGGGTQFAENTTDKLTYAGGWSQRSAGFTLLTDYVLTATRPASRIISGNFLSNVGGYCFAPNSTNYRVFTARAGGVDSIVGTAAVVGKRKSDVLIVGAGGSNFYYENGILSGSVARLGYVAPSSVPFHIGADNGAGVTGSSIVFSAMLWNRELSAAEIRSISANPYQILMPVAGLAKWGLLASTGVTSASIAATDSTDTAALVTTVTTGAAITATDNPDAASLAAAIWTTAQVAATDNPDTASLAATVTTGASIATTDNSDTAAITGNASLGVTSASIAATDSADTAALATTVTTGASVAATDTADLAALIAAIWTTAQVNATDASDTASLAVSVTTGAVISATDSPDTAALIAGTLSTGTPSLRDIVTGYARTRTITGDNRARIITGSDRQRIIA